MAEIDHSAVPAPEPAKPILAVHLLEIEERQRKRFSERGDRIKTGCDEIDGYVLGGGFERGITVGISGDGSDGRLISLNLLASILISNLSSTISSASSKTKATIIDTTGSFPIPLLASILRSRIIAKQKLEDRNRETTGNYSAGATHEGSLIVEREVQRCLEAVSMNRVFDLEGLWEVLGEVDRVVTTKITALPGDINREMRQKDAVAVDPQLRGIAEESDMATAPHAAKDGVSPDSVSNDGSPDSPPSTNLQETKENEAASNDHGTEIIIIDSMNHIINELFIRREKSEAHILLKTLSRIIHTTAHSSNILTILHNGTVSTKPSYSSDTRRPPLTQVSQPSIFGENPLKPALGRIFDQFIELHLFLSRMPKTSKDADRLYSEDEASPFDAQEVGYCTVVEVLKDEVPNLGEGRKSKRFAEREQRWAALEVRGDSLGFRPAFTERGTMRGLGLERGRTRPQDVGSVAKIYGFGGRRV